MKTIKRNCDECGEEYTTFASEAIKSNFCSAECAEKHKEKENSEDQS